MLTDSAEPSSSRMKPCCLPNWAGTGSSHVLTKRGIICLSIPSLTVSEDLGGTWYEYGLCANFNATKNLHLYADIEAADGGEVDTDYRVNLGARWSF